MTPSVRPHEVESFRPCWGCPYRSRTRSRAEGLPCTGGSLVYRGSVADSDAVVVERLRAAGAIILGKTNTPEFALSATTENRLGDDCRNPWDPTRTSGGSSGGAAASVAAGMGPLAIGSDGGGSVRIPAALCGVFGFKPTYGTIPAAGGFGGMPYFSHIGPLTRSTLDAAMVLDVVAGYDPRDPNSRRSAATRYSRNHGAITEGPEGSVDARPWVRSGGSGGDGGRGEGGGSLRGPRLPGGHGLAGHPGAVRGLRLHRLRRCLRSFRYASGEQVRRAVRNAEEDHRARPRGDWGDVFAMSPEG